eukprot:scaffold121308_cov19-Prasinocladus_malaysianus.AAC.1
MSSTTRATIDADENVTIIHQRMMKIMPPLRDRESSKVGASFYICLVCVTLQADSANLIRKNSN